MLKSFVYRKELAPYDEDWFYVRTASMARHMYIRFGLILHLLCPLSKPKGRLPEKTSVFL